LDMPNKSKGFLWLGWCPASWVAEDIGLNLRQGSSGFPRPGRKVSLVSPWAHDNPSFSSCSSKPFHLPGSPDLCLIKLHDLWPLHGFATLLSLLSVPKQGWDCHWCQDGTSHQGANPVTWAAMPVRQVPLCGDW